MSAHQDAEKDSQLVEPSTLNDHKDHTSVPPAVSTVDERRLVRKVDLILMPLLTISFGLQYYDKAVLNSASIFGIIADLGLSTKSASGVVSTLRYSTANSAFYWGYIIAVLPFALVLQRLPLAKTLSVLIFLWGVTVMLTVVCHDYKGLIAQRVFLGALESSVSPGFVMITNQWYTSQEQATRLGIWYSATGIFSVFSGVVNYGLGKAGGNLAPWKYMYLFAGAWTILWSLVILAVVPDSPAASGRWFNDAERALLVERSKRTMVGATGKDAQKFKFSHLKEAVRDIKMYVFLLMGASIYVCNGGVTAFGARIVSSFGYDSLTTIVILIPGGVFTMVTIYLFGWLAGRFKNTTTYFIPISCIPVLVGCIIIWKASWHHRGVPLFGYYLLPTFGAPYVLLLALSSANVAGSTKKALSAGFVFIGYNVGNIIAPYLVLTPEKAIKYRTTWISIIICMVITSVLSLVLRFYLQWENNRRDATAKSASKEDILAAWEKQEANDATDWENKAFRYSL
ncbi:MFS general substrate transporter [Meredithblackwellia eburnea MCA 4105]